MGTVSMMDNLAVHVMESFDLRSFKAWGAVLFVFLITLSCAYTFRIRNHRLPPGPFPCPIFGNLFSVNKSQHLSLAQLANRYGNIMCVYLGSIRTIVVSDAEMAKELLCVSDAQFASRPIHSLMHTASKYLDRAEDHCEMVVSHYTPKVRELRQILNTELFATRKLDSTIRAREEELARMIDAIESFASVGQPVDFRSVISEFAVRHACRVLFNKAFVHSERSGTEDLQPHDFMKMEEDFRINFGALNIVGDACLSVLRFLDLQGLEKRWKDLSLRKDKMMALLLDWYRKQATEVVTGQRGSDELPECDFVEALLRMRKEGKLSEETVKGLTAEMVVAGTDAVGTTLEWAMLELVHHPSVMQRLQSELDSKLQLGQHLGEDLANQLPYLQAVVKEVLRLHPSAPLGLPHCNTKDAILAGYLIPAGTTVMANIWAINRDSAMWGDNASTFNPNRFLDLDAKQNAYGPDFQLLAFSTGRRTCLGRTLAMRTLCVTIGSLVHTFKWSRLQRDVPTDVEESERNMNIRPKHPLVLQCKTRLQI